MTRTFYVTTPIYYVNDQPHIGHMYTTVVADAVARYHRLLGDDVRFVTGTDEHGQKIERTAARMGIREIDLADSVVRNYHDLYRQLEISHDDFIRTTEPRHKQAVEKVFIRMKERGDIYLGSYEGWYCTGCEAFYPENRVKDGLCEAGHPVERMKEESYFFRLSAFGERLLAFYTAREKAGRPFVLPRGRMNEVRAFVQGGLNDLSISRNTVRWGIPVPGDPRHVLYVWLDALTNYISALGFGGDDLALFERFWRDAEDATVLHFVGKEILRFHTIYWPAFLISAGLPLPTTVYGHGWWLMDDAKMSKSLGNIARPAPLLETVGADPVRYFFLREMSFGSDGTYSPHALLERLNGDLANGLGNLVSRVLTLLDRETGGRIPQAGPETAATQALGEAARAAFDAYRAAFDRYAFSEGLAAIFEFVGEMNRFLVREQPWKLAKDPARAAELQAVLRAAAEGLRTTALWIAPVMPASCRAIFRQLGLPPEPQRGDLARWTWGEIPAGAAIRKEDSLFPRADKDETLNRIEDLTKETSPVEDKTRSEPGSSPAAPAPAARSAPPPSPAGGTSQTAAGAGPSPTGSSAPSAPGAAATGNAVAPPTIEIDTFMNVQLRTARVELAERIPKADRLLRLIVDLGGEKRQIVAGIATTYEPEQLIGKMIVIVANLAPAKLRGVESQGMLLAADSGGGPIVVTFDREVAPGTRVR